MRSPFIRPSVSVSPVVRVLSGRFSLFRARVSEVSHFENVHTRGALLLLRERRLAPRLAACLTTSHTPRAPRSIDSQLAQLYEAHGQRWAEIARHLEGRTDQQCMGRWRRHLDPSVKKDAWSGAEDDKLMRLHDTLGPRWSNISKMLTGRTARQCRARWFQLSAADDDDTGAASDATADGAAVVTVTVGAAGDEASLSRKKAGGRAEKKTQSENMSPSTPSVTEEAGTRARAPRRASRRARAPGSASISSPRRRSLSAARCLRTPSPRRRARGRGDGRGGVLRQRRGTRSLAMLAAPP